MAKKKAAAKEVERKVLSNGVILIKYDDGSYAFLTSISAEDAEEIFGGESEDSDDEEDEDSDEDDEDSDEEDEDDETEEDEDDELDVLELCLCAYLTVFGDESCSGDTASYTAPMAAMPMKISIPICPFFNFFFSIFSFTSY